MKTPIPKLKVKLSPAAAARVRSKVNLKIGKPKPIDRGVMPGDVQ